MTIKKLVLKAVIKKFQDNVPVIQELYVESDSFRTLCEDYHECSMVLDRLKSSKEMVNKGYEEEYKNLLQELEDELMDRINQ